MRCVVLKKTQQVKNHLIDEKNWTESVVPYFAKNRGILDINQALKDFNINADEMEKIKQKIEIKRKQKGTKILSSFGEISASFFLNNYEKMCLIGLRWPKEMFEIQTGLDIVGINPENFDILYAEVKTSETEIISSIRTQKAKLIKELKDKRLDSFFLENTREPATKLWIADLLKKLIQDGKIEGNKATIETIIQLKRKYIRYGILIHTLKDHNFNFKNEFKKLDEHCKEQHKDKQSCNLVCNNTCPDRNPIYFVDLKIVDIKKRIDHIIELELTIIAKHGSVEL